MRFQLDRCAGRRLAEWLRNQEHDVVESRERGPDPGDRTLLAWASAEGRVLITMAKDFGDWRGPDGSRRSGADLSRTRLTTVVIALLRSSAFR